MGFLSGLGDALKGAAGDIAGGLFGLGGGLINDRTASNANSANAKLSREFAQSGIQWRVADAKKAGVHPLAAMGIPLSSGPSSMVGGNDWSQTLGNMGQDISRAVGAVQTRQERERSSAVQALQLERAGLENELLRSQIASVNRASNPSLPSIGSGSVGSIGSDLPGATASSVPRAVRGTRVVPVDVSAADIGNPAKAAGTHPDYTYARTQQGGLAIVPSKDVKELIEDQIIPQLGWAMRNNFGTWLKPPPYPDLPLPYGFHRWKWHPMLQEWRPQKDILTRRKVRWRDSLHGPKRY